MEGTNAPPGAGLTPTTAEGPLVGGRTRSSIVKAVNWLEENNRIGTYFTHHKRTRRYVDLKKQDIFNQLVNLYSTFFSSLWQRIRHLITGHEGDIPPAYAGNQRRFAAAVYVSSWFHDLYVTNRRAVYKLCDAAYSEHYFLDIVEKSQEYDAFLAMLNAHIRPTNVKLTHEDTLFIPRINATIDEAAMNENYFNIDGWIINDSILRGIILILSDVRSLKMDTLSDNALGRPSWLFDWHNDGLAYAWFPTQENYSFEDVTIAFIIGTACTPKLAPRDFDEWQLFPGNVIPADINVRDYQRSRPLTYRGAEEVNVLESRSYAVPAAMTQWFMSAIQPQITAMMQGASSSAPPPPPPTQSQPPPATRSRTGKRPRAGTSTAPSQTGPVEASAIAATSAVGETNAEHEEEEEVATTIVLTPEPTNQPAVTQATVTQALRLPRLAQYRIVTYLYYAKVIYQKDWNSRSAALRMIMQSSN